MNSADIKSSFKGLPLTEQIQLVSELWDAIANDPQALTLSDEQVEELQRRLSEHDREPAASRSWESVKERILSHP